MSNPYDPTQPAPPPIEPTRQEEDLTPPPVPLIPAELPYFQVQRAQAEQASSRRMRGWMIALSILAALVVAAASYGAILTLTRDTGRHTSVSTPPSLPTPTMDAGLYQNWLNQEQRVWQAQGYTIIDARFDVPDYQALYLIVVGFHDNQVEPFCKSVASDYVAQFHQPVAVHVQEADKGSVETLCNNG